MVCKENTEPVPSKTASMFVHINLLKIHADKHNMTPAKSPGFFHITTISSCQAVTSNANKWCCQTQNEQIIGQMCYTGTRSQCSELPVPTQGTPSSFGAGSAQLTSATSRAYPSGGAAAVLHISVNEKRGGGPLPTHTVSSKESHGKHLHFNGQEKDSASHQGISELRRGCTRNLFLLSSPSKSRAGCIPRHLLMTRASSPEVGDDGGLPMLSPVLPTVLPRLPESMPAQTGYHRAQHCHYSRLLLTLTVFANRHVQEFAGMSLLIISGNGTLHLSEKYKNKKLVSLSPISLCTLNCKKRQKAAMIQWASELQLG